MFTTDPIDNGLEDVEGADGVLDREFDRDFHYTDWMADRKNDPEDAYYDALEEDARQDQLDDMLHTILSEIAYQKRELEKAVERGELTPKEAHEAMAELDEEYNRYAFE